ncbi:MAG: thermonuclease family protein [Desulfomonilaceae bacterium]
MKKSMLLLVILALCSSIVPFSWIGCAVETVQADEITLKRDDGTEETFRISSELIEKATMLVVRFSPFVVSAWEGKVIEITRADEIKVMKKDLSVESVRLYGVDGPIEPNPYGKEAAAATAKLVLGKIVKVQPLLLPDPWSRTIAWVSLDGESVNEALLKKGIVWWYRKYLPWEKQLAKLEAEAREARLGLWSLPPTAPPWEMQAIPLGRAADRTTAPATKEPVNAATDMATKQPANTATTVPTEPPANPTTIVPASESPNAATATAPAEQRVNATESDDLAPRRGSVREKLISEEGAPRKLFGDAGSVRQRLKSKASQDEEPATE